MNKEEFPGLQSSSDWVLCDAAGGTQVHQSVISAISNQLSAPTANCFKGYPSAFNTVQCVAKTRQVVAEFFNCRPNEVVFGASMSTITTHLARSIGKTFTEENNIVVTNLDHDGNVSPWVLAANDRQASVRRINFDKNDCLLDLDELESNIDENTKLVAVGAAANSCGSLTPIKNVVEIARNASNGNAMVYVDAVHYAPHRLIDVQELGCDFLTCSTYKFCGPHAAIMYGKEKLLKDLIPYKLSACTDQLPSLKTCQTSKWETGTASFEAIAGIKATIEYIASIGVKYGYSDTSLRTKLDCGYRAILSHENEISNMVLQRLKDIDGVKLYGVNGKIKENHWGEKVFKPEVDKRTPTFAINMEGLTAPELAQELVDRKIACMAGNFYAINFPKLMGIEDIGGFVRLSFFHYHSLEDVERVMNSLEEIASQNDLPKNDDYSDENHSDED